jgi:hypothetical protein
MAERYGNVIDIFDNCIIHTEGKYFFDLDGVSFGKKKFMASDEEIKSRMVPVAILPNKETIYAGDGVRLALSKIVRCGGTVYTPLRSRILDA